MPAFYFEAIAREGKREEGSLDAPSRAAALRLLRERGLQATNLLENSNAAASSPKKGNKSASIRRLRAAELVVFTEELSELIDAGLQLEPALKIVENRKEESSIKHIAAVLREQVREGIPFSRALRSTGSFNELYCNLVAAGETSGSLAEILQRQAEYLAMMEEIRRKVISALIYPSIVFTAAIALIGIFLAFLVPQLSQLLSRSGQQLPLVTRLLVGTSQFVTHWWPLIGAGLIAAFIASRAFLRTTPGKAWWDVMQLRIPLVGTILLSRFFAQLLQTLATVVQNGVPLLSGLRLMEGSTMNTQLRLILSKTAAIVGEGGSLSRALGKSPIFPPVLIDMLAVGEQTGEIGAALQRAAKKYDRELTAHITRMTTLIQPAIIAIVGLFVGIVAYSMITGILSSISSLRTH
ncbi:MAG: type II secretion system F family protein [Chthoniobacterales bacterium]